jgi:peptide/nickel transport system substrate-binding protein
MRLYVLVITVLLLLVACQAEEPPPENAITYGLTLSPSGIDPHINSSAELGIPLRQVYDTLVYRAPQTGEIVPGLATEWTVSEDGLSYTFTLRQDVRFHDGTSFNAQAVATNLDRITDNSDPRTASQRAQFLLGPYAGYEIIDDYTIRVNLSEPYAPLLDGFSQVYLGMASPAALAEYDRDIYQFHQVGTGPYIFEEYLVGEYLKLRPNPDYTWGPVLYEPQTDAIPGQITYRFYTDPPTRRIALESNDVEIVGELPPTDARSLIGNDEFVLQPVSIPGQPMQFLMNTTEYPTDNLIFRQALLYGTNRSAIVDTIFQGFSPIAWGPITGSTLYYNPEVQNAYTYDPDQARALLASIGFEDADENGFLDVDDGDLTITVVHPPWGLTPETAQLLQDQWREIGIRADLEPVPGFSALMAKLDSEADPYNLIAFNSFGLDPSLLDEFFLNDGSSNFTNYSDPELDSLLRQATRELSPGVRRDLYAQVQAIIMNQALILPIREYVNLNVAHERVNGLEFDPYGWFPLMNNVSITETE